MTLTLLLALIAMILLLIIPVTLMFGTIHKPPMRISYVFIGFYILHFILLVSNVYAKFPVIIWQVSTVLLLLFGLILFTLEFKRNKAIALTLLLLIYILGALALLMAFISSM